jgi:hypothetical protein
MDYFPRKSLSKYFITDTIDFNKLTTVTRQTGEYKVDLTRHPKFLLAFGELASGRFPHCVQGLRLRATRAPLMNEIKVSINRNGLLSKKITFKILYNGYDRFQQT